MNTPTHWFVTGTHYHKSHIQDGEGNMVANCYMPGPDERCDANAALIVRAVNSHQALVDALDDTLRLIQGTNHATSKTVTDAMAALKLARGES